LVVEVARDPPPPPPPPIKLIALLALFQSPGVVKLVPEASKYAVDVPAINAMPVLLPPFVELAPAYQLYAAVPFDTNGVNDKSVTLK
jgi:hypothetical protein